MLYLSFKVYKFYFYFNLKTNLIKKLCYTIYYLLLTGISKLDFNMLKSKIKIKNAISVFILRAILDEITHGSISPLSLFNQGHFIYVLRRLLYTNVIFLIIKFLHN